MARLILIIKLFYILTNECIQSKEEGEKSTNKTILAYVATIEFPHKTIYTGKI